MNSLYSKVKRLYENCFYEFVQYSLEKNILHISVEEGRIIVIVSPEAKQITIFSTEEEILSCHQMLGGDEKAIAAYGLHNRTIEEVLLDSEDGGLVEGVECYLKKFKHFEPEKNKVVFCGKFSSGQSPTGLNKIEMDEILKILDKLHIIQEYFEENEITKEFDEEKFCVCEFVGDELVHFDYDDLNNLDLSVTVMVSDNIVEYVDKKLEKIEVKEGTLYLGEVIGENTIETFEFENDYEIDLKCRCLFSMSELNLEHLVYTSLSDFRDETLARTLCTHLTDVGLYDTIITNNVYIYNVLCISLQKLGIELILSEDDLFCNVLTDIFSKISSGLFDTEDEEEMISLLKENFKSMISEQIEQMDNQLDEEDFEEDDFFSENSEYVS